MKELPRDQNNNNINVLNQALVDELKSMGCIQTPRVEAAFQAVLRPSGFNCSHQAGAISDAPTVRIILSNGATSL